MTNCYSTTPKKPTVGEVHSILQQHSALIVHFSGAPKGSGVERGHLYPQDLHHVEAGKAMGGVSCSVVCPTDVFYGRERNATGCIGLILDLTGPNSLVATCPYDCGSQEVNGIRIVGCEVDISVTDIEKSITARAPGSYNEWVLRNYKVLGVFAMPPYEISALSKVYLPNDAPDYLSTNEDEIGISETNLTDVALEFPNLSVYTFTNGQLTAVSRHSDIYRS